ncbi:transmembrane protein 54b isoform X2 [Chanos chanos]|uniref:Transmembrane protein 54b isoform X2 n=1 Tax=Chanos chanos TaxID=29144 RepID=A0A6J2WFJ7_CHACN|nr:keratinocyte-associated protein 3-like isoform X2 [Chanos chanos]
MVCSGNMCCTSLEEAKALMKMGLSMVLVGHVNFLLGALVHGAVLRHISLHKQARAMEYAISNVIALTAGLATWTLFAFSGVTSLLAAASAVGLTVSLVRTIANGGRSLLTHCRFPDAVGYSSITNECPFDPTRIYSTTIILWVPLIVMSVVETVFSGRCFDVCILFLGLPCCCHAKHRPEGRGIPVKTTQASGAPALPRYAPPPRHQQGRNEKRPPERPPEQHELLRTSKPHHSHRSARSAQVQQSPPFNRASLNRSSFWI